MKIFKSKKLNSLKIVSQCHEKWHTIQSANGHCDKCDKQVHDLSKLSKAQALKLFKNNSAPVCLRILRDRNHDIIFAKNDNYQSAKKQITRVFAFCFSYLATNLIFEQKNFIALAETSQEARNNNLCEKTQDNTYSCRNAEQQEVSSSANFNNNQQYQDLPVGAFGEAKFDDDITRNAIGNLFKLIESSFAAWLMISTGLLAIIAAYCGATNSALFLFISAVVIFISRVLLSVFFGVDVTDSEI